MGGSGNSAGTGGAGAGGGAGGSSGGSSDPTALATAICNRIGQCDPIAVPAAFGDLSTCIQREKLGYTEDMAAPGVSVTSAQLSACADAYSKASCGVVYTGGPPSCDFLGTRADGQPCGADMQCKSGYCSITSGSCGTCAELQPAGGSCATDPSDCRSGLICVSGACFTPITAGGQCTPGECATGLVCESGYCAQAGQTGAQCNLQTQDCDQTAGLFCGSNGVCAPIQVANPGAPCGFVGGEVVVCAAGSCSMGSTQTQGSCTPFAADGAHCDQTNGPQCESPASCVNGTCQLPNPATCG